MIEKSSSYKLIESVRKLYAGILYIQLRQYYDNVFGIVIINFNGDEEIILLTVLESIAHKSFNSYIKLK